eukprot:1946226-Prymnesium_polylepis.1
MDPNSMMLWGYHFDGQYNSCTDSKWNFGFKRRNPFMMVAATPQDLERMRTPQLLPPQPERQPFPENFIISQYRPMVKGDGWIGLKQRTVYSRGYGVGGLGARAAVKQCAPSNSSGTAPQAVGGAAAATSDGGSACVTSSGTAPQAGGGAASATSDGGTVGVSPPRGCHWRRSLSQPKTGRKVTNVADLCGDDYTQVGEAYFSLGGGAGGDGEVVFFYMRCESPKLKTPSLRLNTSTPAQVSVAMLEEIGHNGRGGTYAARPVKARHMQLDRPLPDGSA